MPERLPNERQMDIPSDEVRRQRMLEDVWVSLLNRQPRDPRHPLEHAKKLCSVKFSALLARKQVIRAVRRSLAQPSSQRRGFVKQRLSPVRVQGLYRLERPLESAN